MSKHDIASNNESNQTKNFKVTAESTVEVLYQKMGDRWFAFSLIDDEVFMGSITQTEIDTAPVATQKVHQISGNS